MDCTLTPELDEAFELAGTFVEELLKKIRQLRWNDEADSSPLLDQCIEEMDVSRRNLLKIRSYIASILSLRSPTSSDRQSLLELIRGYSKVCSKLISNLQIYVSEFSIANQEKAKVSAILAEYEWSKELCPERESLSSSGLIQRASPPSSEDLYSKEADNRPSTYNDGSPFNGTPKMVETDRDNYCDEIQREIDGFGGSMYKGRGIVKDAEINMGSIEQTFRLDLSMEQDLESLTAGNTTDDSSLPAKAIGEDLTSKPTTDDGSLPVRNTDERLRQIIEHLEVPTVTSEEFYKENSRDKFDSKAEISDAGIKLVCKELKEASGDDRPGIDSADSSVAPCKLNPSLPPSKADSPTIIEGEQVIVASTKFFKTEPYVPRKSGINVKEMAKFYNSLSSPETSESPAYIGSRKRVKVTDP